MRRSCEPGMRYPRSRPESNHLLTVRGATLQIFATCPVVNTFFIAATPIRDSLSPLPGGGRGHAAGEPRARAGADPGAAAVAGRPPGPPAREGFGRVYSRGAR